MLKQMRKLKVHAWSPGIASQVGSSGLQARWLSGRPLGRTGPGEGRQISERQSWYNGPQYPGIRSGKPPGPVPRQFGVGVVVGVGVAVYVAHPPRPGVDGVPVVVGGGATQAEFGWITGGVPLGQISPH